MRVRHIWGIALFCGVLGTFGGQTVQAQSSNPVRFVQLLLNREDRGIKTDTAAIAKQNKDIQRVNGLTGSKAAKLTKTINKLQVQINKTVAKLLGLKSEVDSTLAGFPSASPSIKGHAARNAAIIAVLASRPPFGIAPATSSK